MITRVSKTIGTYTSISCVHRMKTRPLKQSLLFQSISNLLLIWSPMWRCTYDNEAGEIDWNTSLVPQIKRNFAFQSSSSYWFCLLYGTWYCTYDNESVLKRFEHTTTMSCVLLTKYNIAFQEIWNLLILYPMWHMILYLW